MNSILKYLVLCFNIINHSLILSTAVYIQIIVWKIPYKSLQWHVGLCSMGFQLLMAEAILALSIANFWSKLLSHKVKRIVHMVLQVVGSALAIAGVIVELNRHNWSFNWDSNHTIFGLTTTIFLLINLCLGLGSAFASRYEHSMAIMLKHLHSSLGLLTFLWGLIALIYGYQQAVFETHSRISERQFLLTGTITTLVITFCGGLFSYFKSSDDDDPNQMKIN